jgi:hypothetical protein
VRTFAKGILALTGAAALLGAWYQNHSQNNTISELKASQVVVAGPIVVKHTTVAELITLRTQIASLPPFNIPRIVKGPFGGKHISETVSFTLSAEAVAGYRNVAITTRQDGNDLTVEATLGNPEVLAFEPRITPIKFEEDGWVQAFEFGRTQDAGDFITIQHNKAIAALRKKVSTPGGEELTEAAARAEASLRKLFPRATKIVVTT